MRARSEIQIQFKIHSKQQSRLCIQGISSDGKNVRFQVVHHINLHFALFTKPLKEKQRDNKEIGEQVRPTIEKSRMERFTGYSQLSQVI